MKGNMMSNKGCSTRRRGRGQPLRIQLRARSVSISPGCTADRGTALACSAAHIGVDQPRMHCRHARVRLSSGAAQATEEGYHPSSCCWTSCCSHCQPKVVMMSRQGQCSRATCEVLACGRCSSAEAEQLERHMNGPLGHYRQAMRCTNKY